MSELMYRQHYKYLKRCFGCLPTDVEAMEPSRPTLLFFALAAADCLDALPKLVDEKERERMIEWLYSMQVAPMKDSSMCELTLKNFKKMHRRFVRQCRRLSRNTVFDGQM